MGGIVICPPPTFRRLHETLNPKPYCYTILQQAFEGAIFYKKASLLRISRQDAACMGFCDAPLTDKGLGDKVGARVKGLGFRD